MLISIHDVPRYERHLLFCSALSNDRPRKRRPRRRSDIRAINRSLATCNEAVREADFRPVVAAS